VRKTSFPIRITVLCIAAAMTAACSGGGHPLPRGGSNLGSPQLPQAAPHVSPLFERANTLKLSDQDLDRYIDAPLSASQRKLAHHFMSIMPANKRGDFVYVDPQNRVLSNRAAMMDGSGVTVTTERNTPQRIAASSAGRRARDYSSPCSPPHPFAGTGPYIRQVSQCGFTAAIGYVTVGCLSSYVGATNKGYTYMELRGSQGTLTEGGLQYNTDSSIQPYHRSPNVGPDTQYMTNNSVHYTCGQAIGIMQGITPDDNYSFTGVGVPAKSPAQYYLSPNVTWNSASWHYFARQYDMTGQWTDPAGMTTPCQNCSISRVTAIGQTFQNFSDGTRFGIYDTSTQRLLQVHWEQVSMGELVQPCDERNTGSTTCSIKFNTDYRSWFGGYQIYDAQHAFSVDRNFTQADPYEVYEGIDLRPTTLPFGSASDYAFTDPLPPSEITYAHTNTCDYGDDGLMFVYYPGEMDDNGNVVPSGVEEQLTYRWRPEMCT
jgi:hypothetical protein